MWVNKSTCPCFMEEYTCYSCDSFIANRMELDGTMLHYLAVLKAMVSVHLKITLTYSLTWQTDGCIWSVDVDKIEDQYSPLINVDQRSSMSMSNVDQQSSMLMANVDQ